MYRGEAPANWAAAEHLAYASLLKDGYDLIRQTPWLVVAGGLPIILATLGFTFLGESLRDVVDPKLRKQR